jgi:hypothetical protein
MTEDQMTSGDNNAQQSEKTQDAQKSTEDNKSQAVQKGTEGNKVEKSDAQLLLQSKEKMRKVEGSHMNFSEASKREKPQEKNEESTKESSTSEKSTDDD